MSYLLSLAKESFPVNIQKHFPGDTDSTLQKIQQDLYPKCSQWLYERTREKYMADIESAPREDEQLFGPVEDKLYHAIKEKTSFDQGLLWPAYDRMAAWFRFNNTDVWQTSLFASQSGDENEAAERIERLRDDWVEFYREECESIAQSDEMTRAVLNAVGFAGQDRGEDALHALLWLLDKRYRTLTRTRDRWGGFREMREFCDW